MSLVFAARLYILKLRNDTVVWAYMYYYVNFLL